MAIRFTPEYNARINKIVQDYNRRVRRANVEGKIRKDQLPEKVSVKTLKKSYTNRADLERELKNLESFRRKSVRAEVEGVSTYETELINQNRRAAIKYWEKEAAYAKSKASQNYPLQKKRYNEIQRSLDILKKGTADASSRELLSMSKSVEDYRKSFERQATGYRGFLSELDMVMEKLDYPKSQRNEVFEKLSQLNQSEFYELYRTTDLIGTIYQLADSPKYTGGELVIHSSERSAKENINRFLEQLDGLIAEVKSK